MYKFEILSPNVVVPMESVTAIEEPRPEDMVAVLQVNGPAVRATFQYAKSEEDKPDLQDCELLVANINTYHRPIATNYSDVVVSKRLLKDLRPLIEAYLIGNHGRVHLLKLEVLTCNTMEGEILKNEGIPLTIENQHLPFMFVPSGEVTDRYTVTGPMISITDAYWSTEPVVTPKVGFDIVEYMRRNNKSRTNWIITEVTDEYIELVESGDKSAYMFTVHNPFVKDESPFTPVEGTLLTVTYRGKDAAFYWSHEELVIDQLIKAPDRVEMKNI